MVNSKVNKTSLNLLIYICLITLQIYKTNLKEIKGKIKQAKNKKGSKQEKILLKFSLDNIGI